MKKDLDFRTGDLVYNRILNELGHVTNDEDEQIFVHFGNKKIRIYNIDGSNCAQFDNEYEEYESFDTSQIIFHDPDRIIMKSIGEHIKSISKPPKRLVKRYANMGINNIYVLYDTKKEAEEIAEKATFEYLSVAVEIEVDEKLL